ncbi:MAG: glycosyltransferase [Candidatus Zhuqueibacterota bacterium]
MWINKLLTSKSNDTTSSLRDLEAKKYSHLNMNDKIKILQLSSVFVDRGVERIMLWLFQFLPKERYVVKIAVLRNNVPLAHRMRQNGTDIVDVIGMKNSLDIGALFRFLKYIKKLKPDIVHIHHFRTAVLCRPLLKLAGVPVVIYSVHNQWGGKIHYALDRWTTRFGDATVPFSLAVKKFLFEQEGMNPEKVLDPIYIGIDVEKFQKDYSNEKQNVMEEFGLKPTDKILGFVGALSEQKGLTFLIEAVRDLRKKYPELKCLIIGEGEQENLLKAKVDSCNLGRHIFFLGQRYDIPILLKILDVFVLPSLWEGLPQVVLEAMAAGCPVVATDVCGTPEIIDHEVNGLLVPPKDSLALSNAMTRIFDDAELRAKIVSNAHRTIEEKFHVKTMIENFDNLYQKLLKEKAESV